MNPLPRLSWKVPKLGVHSEDLGGGSEVLGEKGNSFLPHAWLVGGSLNALP